MPLPLFPDAETAEIHIYLHHIKNNFPLTLQTLTKKVTEELRLFCDKVAKEEEMLEVRLTNQAVSTRPLGRLFCSSQSSFLHMNQMKTCGFSSFNVNTLVKETVTPFLNRRIHQPGYSARKSV